MTHTRRALLLLPLAAMLFACTEGGNNTADEQTPLTWGTDSLLVRRPIAPGEELCYKIELRLDTLASDSVLSASLAAMLRDSVLSGEGGSVHEAMRLYAKDVEKEWKKELAELYEPEAEFKDMFQYDLLVKGSPVDNGRGDVLSYAVHTESYLGGAHGSHETYYYNFDMESGRLIGLDGIIPAERRKEVLATMEQKLCADNGVSTLADLQEQTGITILGDLYLTNNFLIEGDSITFLFNTYEIAPYSCGAIAVTIPSVPNP